jgi:hypothetical protein
MRKANSSSESSFRPGPARSDPRPVNLDAYKREHHSSKWARSTAKSPLHGVSGRKFQKVWSVEPPSAPVSLDAFRDRQRAAGDAGVPVRAWIGSVILICVLVTLLFIV